MPTAFPLPLTHGGRFELQSSTPSWRDSYVQEVGSRVDVTSPRVQIGSSSQQLGAQHSERQRCLPPAAQAYVSGVAQASLLKMQQRTEIAEAIRSIFSSEFKIQSHSARHQVRERNGFHPQVTRHILTRSGEAPSTTSFGERAFAMLTQGVFDHLER